MTIPDDLKPILLKRLAHETQFSEQACEFMLASIDNLSLIDWGALFEQEINPSKKESNETNS